EVQVSLDPARSIGNERSGAPCYPLRLFDGHESVFRERRLDVGAPYLSRQLNALAVGRRQNSRPPNMPRSEQAEPTGQSSAVRRCGCGKGDWPIVDRSDEELETAANVIETDDAPLASGARASQAKRVGRRHRRASDGSCCVVPQTGPRGHDDSVASMMSEMA